MALHEKEKLMARMDEDIYTSADLRISVPKFKIPAKESNSDDVYSIIHDELMIDGNSRLNLATFCSRPIKTWY